MVTPYKTVLLLIASVFLSLGSLAAKADSILEKIQQEIVAIYKRALPSIVSVEEIGTPRKATQLPEGSSVPSMVSRSQNPQGSSVTVKSLILRAGSGYSIGRGYIVTTADVTEGMKNPTIRTSTGKRLPAKIVGIDSERNIALLKIQDTKILPPLQIGNSNYLAPGNFALIIGNHNGNMNFASLTNVSGVREGGIFAGARFYPALIQIAGYITGGNSGAPLLNARGEVIGMITAAIPIDNNTTSVPFPSIPGDNTPSIGFVTPGAKPQSQTNNQEEQQAPFNFEAKSSGQTVNRVFTLRATMSNAGYALPINDIIPVVQGLEQNRPYRCWLGVDFEIPDATLISPDEPIVLNILKIYKDSPAERAGLKAKDKVIALNDKPMTQLYELRALLVRLRVGDNLKIKVLRDGKEISTNVVMTLMPPRTP